MVILVIVESPGKTKKIDGFLGKNYKTLASYGHIRDLDPKIMSIDIENDFEPHYIINKDKVIKVNELKKVANTAEMVYLASDEDREGEQIAESLVEVLKLKKYKRITFNSITKDAVLNAIKNAGNINKNIVNAQKTRRILDRIVGYEISPVLQRIIGSGLSVGRVQSVVIRIVI